MKKRRGCLALPIVAIALVAFGALWWGQGDAMGSDEEFDRIAAPLKPKPAPKVADKENWYALIADPKFKIPTEVTATSVGIAGGFPPPGMTAPPAGSPPVTTPSYKAPGAKIAFAVAEEIGRRPYFQPPPEEDLVGRFPVQSKVRALAKLIAERAYARLDAGDPRGALADIRLIDHIGTTSRQNGAIIGWLVGRAVTSIGNAVLMKGFAQGRFDRQTALEIVRRPIPDDTDAYMQCVLQDVNQFTIPFLRTGRDTDKIFTEGEEDRQPNFWDLGEVSEMDPLVFGRYRRIDTIKMFALAFSEYEKDLRDPVMKRPQRAAVIVSAAEKSLVPVPVAKPGTDPNLVKLQNLMYRLAVKSQPNAKGNVALGLAFLSPAALRRQQAEDLALRVSAACALYRMDFKKDPSDLQDLVDARILPTLPIDPFDGKALRFDASIGRLWTVGEDGVDGGGNRPGDQAWKMK